MISFFQELRPDGKIESFNKTGKQKKIDSVHVGSYCDHCKIVFEVLRSYYHFCSGQEIGLSLPEQDIEMGNKKQEMDEWRRKYKKEKGYSIQEM